VTKLNQVFKIAFERSTVISSLQVGLVVGIILNLINQWEAISNMDYHLLSPYKIALTFMVPYLVSTYATIKAKV